MKQQKISQVRLREAVRDAEAARDLSGVFAVGYRLATGWLAELLGGDWLLTLAATEASGAHPKSIATTLSGGVLSGRKVWSTMVDSSTHLAVMAIDPPLAPSDRPSVRCVVIPKDRCGVHLEPMPATPFCPGLKHFEISLSSVAVHEGEVFPGDGFSDVLKPFRTIEDLSILLCVAAWIVGRARRSESLLPGRALAIRAAALGLFSESPIDPETHLALDPLLSDLDELLDALIDDPSIPGRDEVVRDRGILSVAAKVRAVRSERAIVRFRAPGSASA